MPDSIDAYERSLKLAPDSLNTLYKVAVAYAEIGRTSAAVDALNRALEIVKRSGSTAEEAKIKKAIDSLRAKPR
jgi:tetratricopeptide (TPR) repeat protein